MAYYLFILVIGAERLVELVVARRNTAWAIAHGGKEFGRGHYRAIVVMHALLLVACIVEVWALHWPFIPRLGWMVAIVLFSTVVRWWSIAALGANTGTHGSSSSRARRWFGADRTDG
jgi:methyltransferase